MTGSVSGGCRRNAASMNDIPEPPDDERINDQAAEEESFGISSCDRLRLDRWNQSYAVSVQETAALVLLFCGSVTCCGVANEGV